MKRLRNEATEKTTQKSKLQGHIQQRLMEVFIIEIPQNCSLTQVGQSRSHTYGY